MVDLRQETFRRSLGAFVDSTNVGSENDFSIVHKGAKIDLFWPHTDLFFVCTIVSWTPLLNARPQEDTPFLEFKPKVRKHKANGKCTASQDNEEDKEDKKLIASTVEKPRNSLRRCSESGIAAASILQSFAYHNKSPQGLGSPETAIKVLISSIKVGLKIEVYWPMDLDWYVCVVHHKCSDGRFKLLYDDGEVEIVRMEDQIWRPLAESQDSQTSQDKLTTTTATPPIEHQSKCTTQSQNQRNSPLVRKDSMESKTEAARILHSFHEQHAHSIVTDEDFCWRAPDASDKRRHESKGVGLAASDNE